MSPKIGKLEKKYGEFRRNTPLSWDSNGNAINPHREQQQYLTGRRSSQYEDMRREETILKSMETVAEQTDDPRIALNVMSQLLGVKVSSATRAQNLDPFIGDSLLAEIDLEKKLLPLIIEKNQNVAQFGPSHPIVKALDQELTTTREELLRLVREQADRVTKLRREWFEDLGDPVERAKETVEAVLYSHRARVMMLKAHIDELDEQIVNEKLAAAKLSQFEQENDQLIREMDQNRELLQNLVENMGRAKLTDEESVTQIVELWAPSKAYLVGPSLLKMAGLGTFIVVGSGQGSLHAMPHMRRGRSPDGSADVLATRPTAPAIQHPRIEA